MKKFIQDGPQLSNQFTSDDMLRLYLLTNLRQDVYDTIEPQLISLGDRVVKDILEMGENASDQEPQLVHYDVWGNRIDKVVVSKGWENLKDVSAAEGLVALGYERNYDEYSRLVQFAKLYLFTPSSAIYTCPLAMTDGAARLLEVYGNDYLMNKVFPHYISRDTDNFWVSGQWMTEKTGGSDLGRTETIARWEDDEWKLYGPKWFTSAITAQTAMTLARIERNKKVNTGSKGLSLFYLKVRNEDLKLNNIRIDRLKNKLGTRALPTAELELLGTPAILIGEEGLGIKQITTMLNITRIYNGISAVSLMRRSFALANDYATKRQAFERYLVDLPLHTETLAECKIELTGSFLLIFYVIELLGKSECNKSSDDEDKLLRLLTPIAKLYTGKKSVVVISELLECLGGAGYLEDSGIPALLRDAHVLSIWEGTTNVLSLDVLRSIHREGTFDAFITVSRDKISSISSGLSVETSMLEGELEKLTEYYRSMGGKDRDVMEAEGRDLSFAIAEVMISILLVGFTDKVKDPEQRSKMKVIANRWSESRELDLKTRDHDYLVDSRRILDI